MIGNPPLIEYKNVSVMRNGRMILRKENLLIKAGEHISILGPNGSGKSTLIKTITRELYPYADNEHSYLQIMGKEQWNVFELRSLLGIVSSEQLEGNAKNYSGEEVILAGFFSSFRIWRHQKITASMRKQVKDVLDLLEVTHLKNRKVNEMSTGEARRILIGRALVHNPKALVLDEPSSSLDLRVTTELRELLRKIAREGTNIIMVTHHLADIIPEIDRVVLISRGKIIEDGIKEQVLTTDSLSSLFGINVDVVQRDGYYHIW